MASLNLLPRKSFEILLDDKSVVRGQYSLWSVSRFCEIKKLSLAQLAEKFENITLDDTFKLILCAVEYTSRKERQGFAYSDIDVAEWIEQLGGLGSDNFNNLIGHSGDSKEADSEEKKSQ